MKVHILCYLSAISVHLYPWTTIDKSVIVQYAIFISHRTELLQLGVI